jgi:phosphate transport system substrate-binding protein
MTRTLLLGAASAAALACLNTASFAAIKQGTIYGGGSTLAQFDYIDEFAAYAALATTKQATFSTYWEAGSGTGQQAFLNDDLTCDINHVTGANGGACTGGAGVGKLGNTVQYGASDATLSSTQLATWATSSFGQSYAGNLIQLPSMGVGVSIPLNETGITSNTQVAFSDNDLCGIFSGKITNFSQITDAGVTLPAGAFKLVYRSDGSGTSFLLTNHLSAVCTTANTKAGVTFTATTTFANLFTAGGGIATVIPNSIGQSGSSGIANYMAGLSAGAVPQAISYLSPDFTTVDPNSDARLSNGEKSPLVVAQVLNGKVKELPTTTNITVALSHAKQGQFLTPPSTAAQGANPSNWVPLIQTVSAGYPISGYTTFDFAQCYSDVTVKTGLIAFLKDHLSNASFGTIQNNNGFVRVANSGASKFLAAINKNILANANSWNENIGNTTVCPSLHGR